MSIIFGLLKERGEPAAESDVLHLGVATERYATGTSSVYMSGRLGMGVQPCISHQRSAMESGPAAGPNGDALSFDGRLDNYKELGQLLGLGNSEVSDSQIILAAFARFGEACFSYFVGDWALVLWSRGDQTLYLARDHAGTRTLYFRCDDDEVLWSTHLDTFSVASSELRLAEDYVARYLAFNSVRDITPYQGVRSVNPAHYLVIRNHAVSQRSHWSSTVRSAVWYSSDGEYEDHFLTLFEQSVKRRTGPGKSVLAELSGGMDSTSIVCMSDQLRRSTQSASDLLDTVSYYDDSEPSLNERPYFTITEAKRGKAGTHLDMAVCQRTFLPHNDADGAYFLPGADSFSVQQERTFHEAVWKRGYGSILSGFGGDEVLGGVPVAFPELADYLVAGRLPTLFRRSVAWSLVDRSPVMSAGAKLGHSSPREQRSAAE